MTSPLEKLLADLERLEKEAPREWLQSFGNRPELRPVCEYYNLCRNNAPLLVSALRECIGALEHISSKTPKCTGCTCPNISLTEHYDFVARECLDKILKMGE